MTFPDGLIIDWQIVPARDAYYFGLVFGGGLIWFACVFLHLYFMRQLSTSYKEREADCALRVARAYRRGAERSAGIQFATPKREAICFLAVDHATRNPANLARKAADHLST